MNTAANKANELIKKYGTRDPFELARLLGVKVMFRDDFTSLYGMYSYVLKNRYIFINSNIDEAKQKIVCAHELGHDLLHREIVKKSKILQDFVLYDTKMKTEYEANVFAACLMVDEDDLLDCISKGYDRNQIANALGCDENLIALKTNTMITEGYKLNIQNYDSGFLKNKKNGNV